MYGVTEEEAQVGLFCWLGWLLAGRVGSNGSQAAQAGMRGVTEEEARARWEH